ncbi:MAG: MFS transporter [Rhodospirillaceae bacterium]
MSKGLAFAPWSVRTSMVDCKPPVPFKETPSLRPIPRAPANAPGQPVFAVLLCLSGCHALNDMNQSMLAAIYPTVKESLALSFAQIGGITLAFQATASVLQPLIGLLTDRKPLYRSLPVAMLFTLSGLVLLSVAASYPSLLIAAALIGTGSAVFHPEASRVARLASGGRHGLAQSLFQVGGNVGSAIGPLLAALIVFARGQATVVWFASAALLASVILWRISGWYRAHAGIIGTGRSTQLGHRLGRRRTAIALAILVCLVFSKNVYLASISSFYTFYLIETFHLSVPDAQICLFIFLGAVAAGTFFGGPIGDRIGRKHVIWISILGVLPFTVALPHVGLYATVGLSVLIGLILASAFSAIVVFGQELVPGRVGLISGLFFGLAFGTAGMGAAILGVVADHTSIGFVYKICGFLPLFGLLTVFLPDMRATPSLSAAHP